MSEERAALLNTLAKAFNRAKQDADTPLYGAVMIDAELNKAGGSREPAPKA